MMVSLIFFFFKQKTAFEMRISDWSSDVCSSDLQLPAKRNDLDGKAGPSSLKLCRPCLGPDPGPGMHRRKRTQIATGRSDGDTTDNPDVLRQDRKSVV